MRRTRLEQRGDERGAPALGSVAVVVALTSTKGLVSPSVRIAALIGESAIAGIPSAGAAGAGSRDDISVIDVSALDKSKLPLIP